MTKVSGMVMAWLLATADTAGTVAWAIGVSRLPGSGLGSILRSLVGGLLALLGVDEASVLIPPDIMDTGVIMGWWEMEVRRLPSITGILVPGSPGSRCYENSI